MLVPVIGELISQNTLVGAAYVGLRVYKDPLGVVYERHCICTKTLVGVVYSGLGRWRKVLKQG